MYVRKYKTIQYFETNIAVVKSYVTSDQKEEKDYGVRGESTNAEHSEETSIARTKATIRDYSLANGFDFFVTLTFDTKKVDSKNIDDVLRNTQKFTRYLRGNDMQYLIVPEYHKDKKKVHLHALIKCNGNVQALQLEPTQFTHSNGKPIFNVKAWRFGWSTAISIGRTELDVLKVSNYIVKYLTKETISLFNKKRYWSSQSLQNGIVTHYSKKEDARYQSTFDENGVQEWDYENAEMFDYKVRTGKASVLLSKDKKTVELMHSWAKSGLLKSS